MMIGKAAREKPRVAFVTCGGIPDLDPDDRLLLAPLAALGVRAEPAVWDAAGVDWAGYDLAVLRSTWDYGLRRDDFVAWTESVPLLLNPADAVRWNTDKRYLAQLAEAGVPVVPTVWVGPDDRWVPPSAGEFVVKPAIGAGSKDAGRYDLADLGQRRLAATHVGRLQAAGRHVMVQPYLAAVDTAGETALVYLAGSGGLTFSHAARKGPMLTGPAEDFEGLYKDENIEARTPTEAELAVGTVALAAVPGGTDSLLYARVDLIPGPDGAPLLVELELAEPSLFLGYAQGAVDRLAQAIVDRLS